MTGYASRPSFLLIGTVVFLANAALLVLQLLAGRLLAPFIGSSLETWSAVIGVFLAGIAAGNHLGGRWGVHRPDRRVLAAILLLGGFATLWFSLFPYAASSLAPLLPLGLRIVVTTSVMCFPAAFAFSLLTPLAIRLGITSIHDAGRIAGRTFALSTFGCLAGNFLTGFVLIPHATVNVIAIGVAAGVFVLGIAVYFLGPVSQELSGGSPQMVRDSQTRTPAFSPSAGAILVFTCSFAGMALELAGVRLMAMLVGVSLFTWTGMIGVMLLGTAVGNWIGGRMADRAHRKSPDSAMVRLGQCIVMAGGAVTISMAVFVIGQGHVFDWLPLIPQIVAWSMVLFLLPMLFFGTVSPQVIRLLVTKPDESGPASGRIYAISTLGAIAGTFATGFALIAEFGALRVVLGAACVPILVATFVLGLWKRTVAFYFASIVAGVAVGGMVLLRPETTNIARETNYFTILVKPAKEPGLAAQGVLVLQLDLLIHSWVKPDDPTFLHYAHEQIQLEVLRDQLQQQDHSQVLVIGGGGYTFPRAARTLFPRQAQIDVVEIDPGVTAVSYERLSLDPKLGIRSIHQDGRQFLSEHAEPGHYDLIMLDAVNDIAVPWHLLTREFNGQIRKAMTPKGIYLVSIIDQPEIGSLWRAALATLRQDFAHVELIMPTATWSPEKQTVYVIYASDQPFREETVRQWAERSVCDPRQAIGGGLMTAASPWRYSHRVPPEVMQPWFDRAPPIILTDQYAPVEWLMADVFRRRLQIER